MSSSKDTAGCTVTEEELNELRNKFQLLEGDRKAYYEISMHQMKENKEAIAKLRESNKALRRELTITKKTNTRVVKSKSSAERFGGAIATEEKKFEAQVSIIRKNLDTIKSQVLQKRKELRKLGDQAHELDLEMKHSEEAAGMKPANEKIRLLENRLDRAMIKYNEAQSIKKTYEQIVQRLTDERTGYDNQLAALERTTKIKQKDYDELLLLSSDANHAKEMSMKAKLKVVEKLDAARKDRDADLKDKKLLVKSAANTTAAMEGLEKTRANAIGKLNGDLSEEEEAALKQKHILTTVKRMSISPNSAAEKNQYQQAFEKIKKATGILDINEVVDKMSHQEATQNNLRLLSKDNEAKLEEKERQLKMMKESLEHTKLSGINNRAGSARRMIDEMENHLVKVRTKDRIARERFESIKKICFETRAGIQHLMEKLESVREDPNKIVLNDETSPIILRSCEESLVSLIHQMRQHRESSDDEDIDFVNEITFQPEATIRPYNNRIIADILDEEEEKNDDGSSIFTLTQEDPEKDNDGILTRNNIKKASRIMVGQQQGDGRKALKKGRKTSRKLSKSITNKNAKEKPNKGKTRRASTQKKASLA